MVSYFLIIIKSVILDDLRNDFLLNLTILKIKSNSFMKNNMDNLVIKTNNRAIYGIIHRIQKWECK